MLHNPWSTSLLQRQKCSVTSTGFLVRMEGISPLVWFASPTWKKNKWNNLLCTGILTYQRLKSLQWNFCWFCKAVNNREKNAIHNLYFALGNRWDKSIEMTVLYLKLALVSNKVLISVSQCAYIHIKYITCSCQSTLILINIYLIYHTWYSNTFLINLNMFLITTLN